MHTIATGQQKYRSLLRLAEERYASGDLQGAAALARVAAHCAYPAEAGLFASPRLEKLLLAIGAHLDAGNHAAASPTEGDRRQNVLHVLSHARPIGGDTRFAWRWIQADAARRHSVAIVSQADVSASFEIPEPLRQATEQSGGRLWALSSSTTRPLDQARELRALCRSMDVIVLHVFPYDIVPVLALAKECEEATVLYVNHSDHTYWVGGSVAHSIVHLREQPSDFISRRRGMVSGPSPLLPIPVDISALHSNRRAAKRTLGYPEECLLLLTIASPFKYSSPGHTGFLDLVRPVLAKHPEAILVAIGPDAQGPWQEAATAFPGRVHALGTRWDTATFYAAADVYLDSVPFSSITSLIEAGSRGLPLLGHAPAAGLELLGPGAPGLEGTMEKAVDAEAYRRTLSQWLEDPELRSRVGSATHRRILALHQGDGWAKAVADVYRHAERSDSRGQFHAVEDPYFPGALDSALAQLYSQVRTRAFHARLIARYIGALPYRTRARITVALAFRGFRLCLVNLLPRSLDALLRRLARSMRHSFPRPSGHPPA